MTTLPRLTTRGRDTAEAIRDHRPFNTSGALSAREVTGLSVWDSGQLSGSDLDRFREDCQRVRFVVYSYATPIAWFTEPGGWHRVEQKFSRTTTKHQGNLYLI
jgi:hypothetical protein